MWQTNKIKHKTVKWKNYTIFTFLKSVLCICVNLDSDTHKENLVKSVWWLKLHLLHFQPNLFLSSPVEALQQKPQNTSEDDTERNFSSWNGNNDV